ncbi:uncharacterized protein LOC123559788 [Mercenaria mercenaria]|uniref:uncharacterized protein LOC123559788 n=1 Tax=Mercenaria mercenaria TaxID=6596 RepID=UPI00234E7B37|nr:uncharacterized protein LOC123559788 [Mercenaria mercenaria]
MDNNGAFQCACSLSYRGKFCHEVMAKCNVIGCQDVTDCISAPSGAVCVCKLEDMGRLCQMDIADETDWEKVKLVISERTIHTGEIIVGVVLGVIALLAILFIIHCQRVNSRRAIVRKRYKDILDKGVVPNEPPPDWCEISGDLIKDTLCCKKGMSLVDAYRPRNASMVTSLSRTQSLNKQKEEELVRLLNSRTDIPEYGNDFPERIDQEISRRASSRRDLGMNNSQIDDRFDRDRVMLYPHSGSRISSFKTGLRRPSFQTSGTPFDTFYQSRNNHAKLQNCSSREELIKRTPQRSQHFPVTKQPSGSMTRMRKNARRQIYPYTDEPKNKVTGNKYDDNEADFEDDYASQSSCKYRNNSARHAHNSDKSRIEKGKTVRYRIEWDTENSRQRLKFDDTVEKKMSDISNNLKNLKKSISNRKFASNTNENSYSKTLQGFQCESMRNGDVRYAMRNTIEKYTTETSSEEESVLEEKLLIRINPDNKTPDTIRSMYPYISQNGNENANNDMSVSSSTDYPRMYYNNLRYYQQHTKRPESYVSNESSGISREHEIQRAPTEDPMFYGHLIDPSMQHDNLETTHWYWDHEPGVYYIDESGENEGKFISFKEGRKSEKQDLSGGRTNTELSRQTGEKKVSQAPAETGCPLKGIGSESYAVWSYNVQLSPNEQKTCVGKKADGMSKDPTKSFDQDMTTDRLYVRSFDDNGQKRYYVSNELESCIHYEYQPRPEMSDDKPVIISENKPTEFQNMPQEQYECSTPTYIHSDSGHEGRWSRTIEDTPSTAVGTANTTAIKTENLDGETLHAEGNASDTEVEL